VYHGLQESVPRLFYKPTSNKINDRFDVICRHSNGALMTTSILSLYTQHDSDFLPNDKIPSAVVLFNAPASFEKERTLSKMLEQHGSSKISVIPSIHEWGGRRDGFYVDRSDKEPPSTTFIIRMESSHSTFPWAPLFCVCARISTHHPVTRAWTARKVSSKPLE
jgi:hypothetical protein